jgi:transcription-repair coupling factor (superfamily II helicase)
VVEIKALCRRAGIAQVDAGPKGASIAFRRNEFANPEALIGFVQASKGLVKVQPDMKLIFKASWDSASARIKGVRGLVLELAQMAERGRKAA